MIKMLSVSTLALFIACSGFNLVSYGETPVKDNGDVCGDPNCTLPYYHDWIYNPEDNTYTKPGLPDFDPFWEDEQIVEEEPLPYYHDWIYNSEDNSYTKPGLPDEDAGKAEDGWIVVSYVGSGMIETMAQKTCPECGNGTFKYYISSTNYHNAYYTCSHKIQEDHFNPGTSCICSSVNCPCGGKTYPGQGHTPVAYEQSPGGFHYMYCTNWSCCVYRKIGESCSYTKPYYKVTFYQGDMYWHTKFLNSKCICGGITSDLPSKGYNVICGNNKATCNGECGA